MTLRYPSGHRLGHVVPLKLTSFLRRWPSTRTRRTLKPTILLATRTPTRLASKWRRRITTSSSDQNDSDDSEEDNTSVSDVDVSDVSSVDVSSSSEEEESESEEDSDEADSDDSDDDDDALIQQRQTKLVVAADQAKAAAKAAMEWQPKSSPAAMDRTVIVTTPGSDGAQALGGSGKPFARVDSDYWGQVVQQDGGAMADSSYEAVFSNTGFGAKSNDKLQTVRNGHFLLFFVQIFTTLPIGSRNTLSVDAWHIGLHVATVVGCRKES
jgi:hypothetical protein